jgi:mono/diheme cytochrome c family protein
MLCAFAGALLFGSPVSPAQTPSRGELLYSTHCIACHNSQMHWRDKRLATDWASLEALVRRWQAQALLAWSEEDILAVTRHLNQGIYRFADVRRPGRRRGTRAGANAAAQRQRLR